MLHFSPKAHFWNLQVLEVSFHMQHVAKKLFPADLQPSKEFFIRNSGEPLLNFSEEIFRGRLRIWLRDPLRDSLRNGLRDPL